MTDTRTDRADDQPLFKGLPRRIHVGAFVFRIRVEPPEHEMLVDCYGCCDTENCRITVSSALNAAFALNTVMHELKHATNWVYGLDDDSTEEQFTNLDTNATIDMWQRNPRLFLWISKTLRRAKQDAHGD